MKMAKFFPNKIYGYIKLTMERHSYLSIKIINLNQRVVHSRAKKFCQYRLFFSSTCVALSVKMVPYNHMLFIATLKLRGLIKHQYAELEIFNVIKIILKRIIFTF